MVLLQSGTTEYEFSKGFIFLAVSSINCKHILVHLKNYYATPKKVLNKTK